MHDGRCGGLDIGFLATWFNAFGNLVMSRVANRLRGPPGFENNDLGFRLVRIAP